MNMAKVKEGVTIALISGLTITLISGFFGFLVHFILTTNDRLTRLETWNFGKELILLQPFESGEEISH